MHYRHIVSTLLLGMLVVCGVACGKQQDEGNYFDPNAVRRSPPPATPAPAPTPAPPPAAPAPAAPAPAVAPTPTSVEESTAPVPARTRRRLRIGSQPAGPEPESEPATREDELGQATAVKAIGPNTSNPDLIALLRTHENKYVRGYAAEVLAERHVTTALDALYAAMDDPERYVQRRAAVAVGRVDPCTISDRLLLAFEAENAVTRFVAIGAATEALLQCGDTSLPDLTRLEAALAELTRDPDVDVRAEAITLYGRLDDAAGAEEKVNHLVGSLDDASPDVRLAAIRALDGRMTDAAVNAMIPMMDDEDIRVQKAAMAVMATSGHEEALLAVTELLHHRNTDMRVLAVRAIGELRDPRWLEPLVKVLEDRETRVRFEGVKAVAKTSPDEAPFILIQMLKDPSTDVRLVAAHNLAQLCPKNDPEVACAVARATGDSNEDVALALLAAVRCTLSRACVDDMVEALCDSPHAQVQEDLAYLLERVTHSHPAPTCAAWREWLAEGSGEAAADDA